MSENILQTILNRLNSVPDILGSVIISYPAGIPIAKSWGEDLETITASGLVSSIKLTLDRLYQLLRKSKLLRVFIESEDGNIIIANAGEHAIIVSFLAKYANIPMTSFEIKNIAIKVEKLLK